MNPNPSAPLLDDCLKLLRGDKDEHKLAGLLLATKFCQGDDPASIRRVYDAVSPRFLHRLLMTGLGKIGGNGGENREDYLKLSVTVIAALCRVSEVAASEGMVSKVPLVAEVVSTTSDPSISEEGYESLSLVAAASENGIAKFYEPGVLDMLAHHISTLADDSRSLELAMRLMQLIVNRLLVENIYSENISGISCMVISLARQFAVLHNTLKFDALHMLSMVLSTDIKMLHESLRSTSADIWATHVRIGIAEILQNRVVASEKLQALFLADSMMGILGENWLLEHNQVLDDRENLSVNKFLMLVLESSRIEVDILLNDVAYLKYEASKSSSNTAESILQKQKNLAIPFSLLEKIIKLICNVCAGNGSIVDESTLKKVIEGFNATVSLILDFLQDSKDHGQRKGNDLLAAVRIVASYLAETPFACKEKTQALLGYLLSVEGEEEQRPFYSVCFLLPMLCQITLDTEGCKALVSVEGHKAVIECLVNMVESEQHIEDHDRVSLACDTILNLLLKRKELDGHLEGSQFIRLICALACWTENSKDSSLLMISSSICSLVFDLTSEESLLKHMRNDLGMLEKLSQLIIRSLSQGEGNEDLNEHSDLYQIILTGHLDWADRFPRVRVAVERALSI